MSSKYVVAYCDIAQQYYKLALKNDNKTVSDFTFCSCPTVRGRKFSRTLVTDSALRTCPVCGSRTVAKCDCQRRNLPCEPLIGFRFSCIYCKNLSLLGLFDK